MVNPYPRHAPPLKKLVIEGPIIEKIEGLNAKQEKETSKGPAENSIGLQTDASGSAGDATGVKEESKKEEA